MLRKAPAVPLRQYLEALLAEKDKRDRELREADNLRLQQRFDASEAALKAALLAADTATQTAMTAAEKAVTKAETATEKRFEGVNEFRQALSDQTSSFASRVELRALDQRVTDLGTRMDKTEGRSTGLSDGTKMLISIIALLATLLGLYLTFHR
jgi:hypothetical protein